MESLRHYRDFRYILIWWLYDLFFCVCAHTHVHAHTQRLKPDDSRLSCCSKRDSIAPSAVYKRCCICEPEWRLRRKPIKTTNACDLCFSVFLLPPVIILWQIYFFFLHKRARSSTMTSPRRLTSPLNLKQATRKRDAPLHQVLLQMKWSFYHILIATRWITWRVILWLPMTFERKKIAFEDNQNGEQSSRRRLVHGEALLFTFSPQSPLFSLPTGLKSLDDSRYDARERIVCLSTHNFEEIPRDSKHLLTIVYNARCRLIVVHCY